MGLHIFFAAVWVGGGCSLIAMQAFLRSDIAGARYGIDISLKFIDDFIIIPGAMGCLATGLVFSLFTNWGFFKHAWITVKWAINIGGVLFGTFFLGPWLNSLPPISKTLGAAALSDPLYIHNKFMNQTFGPVQVATLVFAVFISVLKPWRKK